MRTRPGTRALTIAAIAVLAAVVPTTVSAGAPSDDTLAADALARGVEAKRIGRRAVDAERLATRATGLVDDLVAARGPFVPVVGPVDYGTAENAYGAARSDHIHAGQDMFAKPGTPEVAVADGVIAETGSDGGQGNYVYLYDPARKRTYIYMHMIEPAKVRAGEQVRAGQLLGGLGCTGSCWGDHLHFEIRAGRGITGEPTDPLPQLKRWQSLDKPR